jgi:hypothetical protein
MEWGNLERTYREASVVAGGSRADRMVRRSSARHSDGAVDGDLITPYPNKLGDNE